jgi:5-methyltetrahydropteroyltriglutamate--homocysteine methyltransferase
MAFSKQKLKELSVLKNMAEAPKDNRSIELAQNIRIHSEKKASVLVNKPDVQKKVKEILTDNISRNSNFPERSKKQNNKFRFGHFPTTTIGSFPQTKEVRVKRKEFKQGQLTEQEYESFLRAEIKNAVQLQEEIGLDVLVHGEFERNDMVEYFGELLDGFAFTENGWVQSYGSRGVKPPVIYGDVSRKASMTVKWSAYAQSLTNKKMKGMLTGPVTILQWSFVRNDQPREITTYQIANALREEVLDLEKAGIEIIQIDEPALREGLPLKKINWQKYLDWAVKAFRICSWGVSDETQIHTHMCYSEFNDIMEAIAAMDADVISIETSRSHMELLNVFRDFKYPNQIGPGVYDIHSPRIPTAHEMEYLITEAKKYIPAGNLWINPDCGLKTRNWDEVRPSLENMVKAASLLRKRVNTPL